VDELSLPSREITNSTSTLPGRSSCRRVRWTTCRRWTCCRSSTPTRWSPLARTRTRAGGSPAGGEDEGGEDSEQDPDEIRGAREVYGKVAKGATQGGCASSRWWMGMCMATFRSVRFGSG